MAPSIDIVIEATGERATLALCGELDTASCGVLRECVEAVDPTTRTVVIDLAGLTFIDGAGVTTLLSLSEELDVQLRTLAVVSASGQVERVLQMAGAAPALGLI